MSSNYDLIKFENKSLGGLSYDESFYCSVNDEMKHKKHSLNMDCMLPTTIRSAAFTGSGDEGDLSAVGRLRGPQLPCR